MTAGRVSTVGLDAGERRLATGPAPGHAQPGRSDRRLTPASRKGRGQL